MNLQQKEFSAFIIPYKNHEYLRYENFHQFIQEYSITRNKLICNKETKVKGIKHFTKKINNNDCYCYFINRISHLISKKVLKM